jgi:hypothetical protein
VLILPPGHAESVRNLRTLSAREKRLISGILVVVAAVMVVLAISFGTAGPTSSDGCIYVTIPAATGAQQIHQCGTEARDTCGSARTRGAFTSDAAQSIVAACRKARIPVGP